MLMTELVPSLQKLVDTRLDNIDRALMSTDTSRAERKQIVSAVEDQILEMLGRLNRDDPSREDILSVLAQLDPPEAYVGTSINFPSNGPVPESRSASRQPNAPAAAKLNELAVVCVTLATLSAVSAAGWWVVPLVGLILLFLFTLPASVLGIIAICQIADPRKNQKGLWMAILGAASPLISLVIAGLAYLAIVIMQS